MARRNLSERYPPTKVGNSCYAGSQRLINFDSTFDCDGSLPQTIWLNVKHRCRLLDKILDIFSDPTNI
jgi:hypothetical protein